MDSKTIFRFLRELSVVLNRCGSLVKSTMASFGAVLTLSGVPPLYAIVLPAKRCPVCTTVFLDLDQTCMNRDALFDCCVVRTETWRQHNEEPYASRLSVMYVRMHEKSEMSSSDNYKLRQKSANRIRKP